MYKGVAYMEIERLSRDEMKVVLSEDDLDKMNLTYDSFDYENPTAKRAIRDILNKAKEEIGFISSGGRVTLALYPKLGGGCELYATRLCTIDYYVCFTQLDNFLSAKAGLEEKGINAVWYTDGMRYYAGLPTRSAALFAGEFGGVEARITEGFLKEHGKRIT
jgi:hypothetical protein